MNIYITYELFYEAFPKDLNLLIKKYLTKEDFIEDDDDIEWCVLPMNKDLPFNNIEIVKNDDKVRFIDSRNRLTTMKIGRFLNLFMTVLKEEVKPVQIEVWANYIKAFTIKLKPIIVQGEEIRECYKSDNTELLSTLGSSCMRSERCQPYFDIYVKNKNVRLLVLKDNDTVIGRALLWTLTDGKVFMDRIYYSREYISDYFAEYAIKNNMYYKPQNSSMENDISAISGEFYVQLENFDFFNYPYMDTMKYLNFDNGVISNISPKKNYLKLDDTDGFWGYSRVESKNNFLICISTNDFSLSRHRAEGIGGKCWKNKDNELQFGFEMNDNLKTIYPIINPDQRYLIDFLDETSYIITKKKFEDMEISQHIKLDKYKTLFSDELKKQINEDIFQKNVKEIEVKYLAYILNKSLKEVLKKENRMYYVYYSNQIIVDNNALIEYGHLHDIKEIFKRYEYTQMNYIDWSKDSMVEDSDYYERLWLEIL